MKIIVFNGPKGVGKDTAGHAVLPPLRVHYKGHYNAVEVMKMADPLKKGVHAIFNLFYSPQYYDDHPKEKNAPHPLLFGISPRKAYIWLSNAIIKKFGPDAVAKITLNKMHNTNGLQCVVFTDSGIYEEQLALIDYVGEHNYLIVEIRSPNHTFDGDSRTYLGEKLKRERPNIHFETVQTWHDGPEYLEMFRAMITSVVMKFVEAR